MSKKWGMPTWIFLHAFAEKVNGTFYSKNVTQCLTMLNLVFKNLPCPYCSAHAVAYFRGIKPQTVRTKQQLVQVLYDFHNAVNRRVGKRPFKRVDLKRYKAIRMDIAVNGFMNAFNHRYDRTLMAGHIPSAGTRRAAAATVLKWFYARWGQFQG